MSTFSDNRVEAMALHGCFTFYILNVEEHVMSKENILAKEYLTIKDVKEYLSISQSMAYELSHRKDFPVCRFGGAIRIPRDAFLQWIELHTFVPKNLSAYIA